MEYIYIEESARGVSQKTWDKMDSAKRKEYLEKNPTSRYAEKVAKEKPVKSIEQENVELKQQVSDLQKEVEELKKRLSAYENPNTDKVNNIMDSMDLEDNRDIDNAIFELLDTFPELEDKFLSKGDGIGNIKPMSKEDKLELLAKMLKSLSKDDLDKVLDKLGIDKKEDEPKSKKDDYKYQKLTPEMVDTLKSCGAKNIKENKDGSIDIDGDCDFYFRKNITNAEFDKLFLDEDGKLKIKFNKVSGDFILPSYSKIISLEGCPKELGGNFNCEYNDCLKSLKGAPKKVGGSFNIGECTSLNSLKGAPEKVGGEFSCSGCSDLNSLNGAPKEVGGPFWCDACGKKFTSDEVRKYSNVKGNIWV